MVSSLSRLLGEMIRRSLASKRYQGGDEHTLRAFLLEICTTYTPSSRMVVEVPVYVTESKCDSEWTKVRGVDIPLRVWYCYLKCLNHSCFEMMQGPRYGAYYRNEVMRTLQEYEKNGEIKGYRRRTKRRIVCLEMDC